MASKLPLSKKWANGHVRKFRGTKVDLSGLKSRRGSGGRKTKTAAEDFLSAIPDRPKGYDRVHTMTKTLQKLWEEDEARETPILVPKQQVVMRLYYNEKLSTKEIAKLLGITQGAIVHCRKRAERCLREGKPSYFYQRDSKNRIYIPWKVCRKNMSNIEQMIGWVLRMRFEHHYPTTWIAKTLNMPQPRVSAILGACVDHIKNEVAVPE